eukprot:TRINITY_DN1117_c0_g1_i3.p2 TRINITY_DN1117_c0_g1~~TRINITY_DN1117_c0_g1_i3.p2  ORF type:complete len:170 (+),score=3.31 TRINITY_DN1117_c0_g1_i3:599-1108(+)
MDDDLDIDHAELIARYLKLSEKFNELLRADKQLTMAYHAMSQLKVEQDIQLEITNQQVPSAGFSPVPFALHSECPKKGHPQLHPFLLPSQSTFTPLNHLNYFLFHTSIPSHILTWSSSSPLQLKQAQEQVIRLSRSIASGTVRPTSQSFHHFSIRSSPYLSPLSSALHY